MSNDCNGSPGAPANDPVPPSCVCPHCGEDRMDWLVWTEDEWIRCTTCGTCYDPITPECP